MASSVNFSLAVVVALFSGFVILGAVVVIGEGIGLDECGFLCEEAPYLTCANYPGKQFPGCNCECRANRPTDGHGCVIHEDDGPGEPCND